MKTIIAGYPIVTGNKRESVLLHSGPADYTPYDETTGQGGDIIEAREFGLKFFDALIAVAIAPTGENVQVVNMVETRTGVQTECALVWRGFDGTQKALHDDLHDVTVRLIAIGE